MPVPAEQLPSWRQLVRLEPGLADLEDDARSIKAGPHFCANTVWYRNLKPRLLRLVGWSRRRDELPKLVPPLENGAVPASWFTDSPEARKREELLDRLRRREAHAGLAILWTNEVYDLAYEYLYYLLPDCSDTCSCAPRGWLQLRYRGATHAV